jgi:2-polyprenyl-6-methoxyphenol hydroxylase-like FAD-dependent oxidoreductase
MSSMSVSFRFFRSFRTLVSRTTHLTSTCRMSGSHGTQYHRLLGYTCTPRLSPVSTGPGAGKTDTDTADTEFHLIHSQKSQFHQSQTPTVNVTGIQHQIPIRSLYTSRSRSTRSMTYSHSHSRKKCHIAIVGMGTAGASIALFLAQRGFTVSVFERTSKDHVHSIAAGAGLLLQPVGLAVLHQLDALDVILDHGARIERLFGTSETGSTIMNMKYEDDFPQQCGIGIHRSTLFHALQQRLISSPDTTLHFGTDIVSINHQQQQQILPLHQTQSITPDDVGPLTLTDSSDNVHGPYDMVLVCGGAKSSLRDPSLVRHAAKYAWGAYWTIVSDTSDLFPYTLRQWYRSAHQMLGALPTGYIPNHMPNSDKPLTSLFWSLPCSEADAFHHRGIDAWKSQVLSLAPEVEPLIQQVQHMDQLVFASYWDVRMRAWHSGNIGYLGDAAHACSPQLGQGANLALFDASVLISCIDDALASDPSMSMSMSIPRFTNRILTQYSSERRSHLRLYQTLSSLLTPLFQSNSRSLALLRDYTFPISQLWPFSKITAQVLGGLKKGIFTSYPHNQSTAKQLTRIKTRPATYAVRPPLR